MKANEIHQVIRIPENIQYRRFVSNEIFQNYVKSIIDDNKIDVTRKISVKLLDSDGIEWGDFLGPEMDSIAEVFELSNLKPGPIEVDPSYFIKNYDKAFNRLVEIRSFWIRKNQEEGFKLKSGTKISSIELHIPVILEH